MADGKNVAYKYNIDVLLSVQKRGSFSASMAVIILELKLPLFSTKCYIYIVIYQLYR